MAKPEFTPRPLQLKAMLLGVKEPGFRLFLKPGRGKTAVALKIYSTLKSLDMVDCMLVIAPLRVVMTSWPQEIERWADFDHLTYTLVHGGQEARRKALKSTRDIYLLNAEGLIGSEFKPICRNPMSKRKVYDPNPYAVQWFEDKRVMLVCDESTMFKNPNALRSISLKQYLHLTNRRCVMTGTPRPGKLENLFFQAYITDFGKDLGRFITHFRNKYMYPDPDGFGFCEQAGANQRVAEIMAPTTIVSEGDDDMPTMVVPVWVPMPPKLKEMYNELKREFLLALGDSTVLAPNAGVLWGKLRQFAQGAIFDTEEGEGNYLPVHEGKLDALEGILEELDEEPAFCLYAYRHDYERIEQRLGRSIPRIGGGVSAGQGAAHCRMFSAGQIPLLLGHPASVARGIDGLQNNCRNVIWFGNTPSWEEYYQANLRIARHGTKAESVTIYQIMLDCGVERAILEKCQSKEMGEGDFLELLRSSL